MADQNWLIKEGDEVTVYFEHVEWVKGVVRSRPCATGDSWVIENNDGVHYVQLFARMTRENPQEIRF